MHPSISYHYSLAIYSDCVLEILLLFSYYYYYLFGIFFIIQKLDFSFLSFSFCTLHSAIIFIRCKAERNYYAHYIWVPFVPSTNCTTKLTKQHFILQFKCYNFKKQLILRVLHHQYTAKCYISCICSWESTVVIRYLLIFKRSKLIRMMIVNLLQGETPVLA